MIQIMTAVMLMFSNAHANAHINIQSNVQSNNETNAIKAMAGCYKVDFAFHETEKTDPNYPISSQPYHEWGTEWIGVDLDTANEIHLQHVLVTPDGPLKHWREEWVRDPSSMMSFMGDNTWETGAIVKPAKSLWLQRVYQVDDSPRYECAASWNITADSSTWYCKSWSPLPRREFSQRSDYNVLDRGSFVVLTNKGWVHHQNNDKVISTEGKTQVIAKEIGANTYEKIDDAQCESAQKYWDDNKGIWHDIQAMWKHIYSHHKVIKLKAKVDGKTLWMSLFELADTYAQKSEYDSKALQKDAHDIIHKYMENHE